MKKIKGDLLPDKNDNPEEKLLINVFGVKIFSINPGQKTITMLVIILLFVLSFAIILNWHKPFHF